MTRNTDLDTLLALNNTEYHEENGYWYKIEARKVAVTTERPHGIRYSLTLHDNHNQRIFGIDNAHAPPKQKKKYSAQVIEYDHLHNDKNDKGTAYHFESADNLISYFFKRINKILNEIE